jgi:DNA-binding response OmpR family regulator
MHTVTIIFATLEHELPDARPCVAQYLAPHGYCVIPAHSAEEVLEIIGRELIDCVVLTAPLALHPLDSGVPLIQALPLTMPTVTFGNSRGRDRDWIRQCAGRRNQEWGHIPFDVEELLIKMRRVMAANNP